MSSPTVIPIGRSVRTQKTGELIAAFLRSRIVRGDLVEGDLLPAEPELMAQFDVSRPTLREAFRILEAESLIVIRRGSKGARVVAPDVGVAARYVGLLLQTSNTTLHDVYGAREVLEPPAAGMLAAKATAADVAALLGLVEDFEQALARDVDLREWIAHTQRFHQTVMELAGNRTLALQSAVLREVVNMHLALAGRQERDPASVKRQYRKVARSYRRLVELIEANDAAGAEAHWRTHMEVASRSLLKNDLGETTVLDLFS